MMDWMHKKRLAAVLNGNSTGTSPLILECRTFFADCGPTGYTCTGKVARDEAIQTYERRSELPEKTRAIAGYAELLEALNASSERYLRIHSFGDERTTFVVFTDSRVRMLLGVLVSTRT